MVNLLTAAAQARGKVGLMGVDVELPRAGKVYYFRSLSGGAPIRLEADKAGLSMGARIAILLLVLAAASVVGMAVRRRFAPTT